MQSTQLGLGALPTGASLWKVDYEFGELQTNGTVDALKNSGNIARQTLTVPGTSFVQSYRYDAVQRLTEAVEKTGSTTNWSQEFGYDRYGNRTSFSQNIGGVTTNTTPAVNANTNRFTSTDFAYDANGNIVSDIDEATNLPRQFIFNGDNKQTEVKRDGVTIGRYYYDGEGRRVKKVTDTETTIFVYSAGQLIAEYSTAISQTPSVSYTTSDHLGSPRVITNQNAQVTSRRDFMPFGEELYAGVGTRTGDTGLKYSSSDDDIRQKFTGYERDIESELDFAQARYYNPMHGRFTSPDDFVNDTHVSDPKSWNLYVYVRNNPLALTDPEGEKIYAGDITNQADRDEFLKRANFTYGCSACVTIDKDGFLAVDTSGLSKDVLKATSFLTDAINTNDPSKLFSVQVTNNNKDVAFGDSQAGSAGVQLPGNNFKTSAIRIRLDFADDKWVSGDKDAKSAKLNLVFAHEVGHFYPDYIRDPEDGRKTGPVVDKVNEIQQALGLPLRAEYSARQTTSGGPWVEVGFGKAKTDKAGQILRNNGAIQVQKQNKVVRWVRNNVGGKGIN